MSSHVKASSAQSDRRRGGEPGRSSRRGRTARAATLLAAAAFATLLLAASAQAFSYEAGAPLITGKQTTSVAVNQSSGDLYVASVTSTLGPVNGPDGALQRFSSSGTPLSCALDPAPSHPAGLAIDPSNGNVVSVNLGFTADGSELRTYPAGCGAEIGVNSGAANTTEGSSELTGVSMAHPLQLGQGISGPGIPTASLTGDITSASTTVTNVTLLSGTLEAGQAISATGVSPATVELVGCVPNCAAPTELELSASPLTNAAGAHITARTVVKAVNEGAGTVELSNPAEETHAPASIEGTAWRIQAAITAPIGQPTADAAGNVYWPNRTANALQKLPSWGEAYEGQGLTEGGFPAPLGRPAAVARDAQGNFYVTTTGRDLFPGGYTCNNVSTNGQLVKLLPNGEPAPEGGPVGAESVFAGLTTNVATVAVDQKTGNIYVGRGCGATFKVEVYGPGGGKMAESIGEGLFLASPISTGLFNQLAINEDTHTLYAADPGNELVWTFSDTSPQKTLSTSVPGGDGEIVCNGTEECLSEYDEGQEVIVEAQPDPGLQLKEWTGGTNSAAACDGTTGPCTFTLSEDSSIEAVFETEGTTLTVNDTGPGETRCKVEGGPEEACPTAGQPEGVNIEVIANPNTGAHLESISGTNSFAACSSSPCSAALNEDSEVDVVYALDSESFSESVTGDGALQCEDETVGGGFGACVSSYPYGHTIAVKATPNIGSHLQGGLSGTGSAGACSGSECSFEITESTEVSATFALDEEPLTIEEPGGGTGEVKCNGGSCAGPWHYGDSIEVTATPTGGSTLGTISGTGSAGSCSASPCSFEITEASSVSVTFNSSNTSTLYVFKGGNGGGTVASDPAGISCGAEPCEATYEEGDTIELTASPESGSVVAGWIGCRPVAGEIEKCNVTLDGPAVAVTAVFLVEGIQGEDGETGPAGPPGNAGEPGVDGEPGPTGPQGIQGPAGQDGSDGADGLNGTDGKNGQNGAPGPQGPQGPQGAQGPRGQTGKVRVICQVRQRGSRVRVVCRVQQARKRKHKRNRLRWRLMKGGQTRSHGVRRGALRLNLRHLRPGRYVLKVNGQRTTIVVPARRNHSSHR